MRAALLTGVIGTTGYVADGFSAANSLPNTFYLLIAGGAVNAIFVPQIVRAKLRPDGDEFVNRIITISLAILAAATVVMVLLAPLAVRLFYNVHNAAALNLATVFAVICLPQIFFYGLYTILGQVLNAHGRFAGYMWAPALANIVAIGGLVWFQRAGFPTSAAPADWTPEMIAILAGSATLSIVVQALSLLVPLRRIGFRYRPVWGIRGHGLGEVSTVAKWTFGSIVVSTLGFVVTSRVLTRATNLGVDAGDPVAGLAAFNPALLITMLLHGLITVSLITALYTRLSEAAARGDSAEVMRYHHQGMRLPSVILVPGVVFVGVLAPYVAATLFFKNTLEETRAIAVVLAGLIWLVIPMAWTYLNDRVFYAHQMTWMTFRLQCVSTGLSTVGALVAATMVPSLTAFTLSIGQALAYVVTASRRVLRCCAAGTDTSACVARRGLPQARGARGGHRAGPVLADPHGAARPRRDPRRARVRRRRPRARGGRHHRAHRDLGRRARPRGPRDRRGARAVHAAAPTALSPPVPTMGAHPLVAGGQRRARVVTDEGEEQR